MLTVSETIASRVSVRRYQQEPLPEPLLQVILESGDSSIPLYPHLGLRFILIEDGPAFVRRHGGALYNYGRILGAPHYIAAISETKPGYMVNAGFRMEQLILHATALGIGTCWLGGGYRRQDVGQMLDVESGEQVVALTPLGYPGNNARSRIVNTAIHLLTPGRGKRRPLEQLVFAGRWGNPMGNTLQNRPELSEMLEAARLAPSWVNSQPWRFVVRESVVVIAVSRPAGQNELPYYLLDGGIAMSHIYLVAREAVLEVNWEVERATLDSLRHKYHIPMDYDILGRMATAQAVGARHL